MLLALVGCGSGASTGDGAGGSPSGGGFVAAIEPKDACALLDSSDVSGVVPGAVQGDSNETTTEDAFSVGCGWSNGDRKVSLIVLGARREAALTSIVGAEPGANRGSWMAVPGLGDAAGYFASATLPYCGVVADSHSYSVEVSASSAQPMSPLPAETFVPLVRKVLGQLQ